MLVKVIVIIELGLESLRMLRFIYGVVMVVGMKDTNAVLGGARNARVGPRSSQILIRN